MAQLGDANEKEVVKGNTNINNNSYSLNLSFNQLGHKLDIAQRALDAQVWDDVKKYMPIDTSNLIDQTNALNEVASGKVYLFDDSVVYGHYQYEGIVYVDPVYGVAGWYNENTGQWWSRKGVEKIPSNRRLVYSNPMATSHWGETAIMNHGKEWQELVKRAMQ